MPTGVPETRGPRTSSSIPLAMISHVGEAPATRPTHIQIRERLEHCRRVFTAQPRSGFSMIPSFARQVSRILDFDQNGTLQTLFEHPNFQFATNSLFTLVETHTSKDGILTPLVIFENSATPHLKTLDTLLTDHLTQNYGSMQTLPYSVQGRPLSRLNFSAITYDDLGLTQLELLDQYQQSTAGFAPESAAVFAEDIDALTDKINRGQLATGFELCQLHTRIERARIETLRAASTTTTLAQLIEPLPSNLFGHLYDDIAARANRLEAYVAQRRGLSLRIIRKNLERPEDPSAPFGARGEILGLSTLIGDHWTPEEAPTYEILAINPGITIIRPHTTATQIELDAVACHSTTGKVAVVEIKADTHYDGAYFLHQFFGVGGTCPGATRKDVCQFEALLPMQRMFEKIDEVMVLCLNPGGTNRSVCQILRIPQQHLTIDTLVTALEFFGENTFYLPKTGTTLTQSQVRSIGRNLRRQLKENPWLSTLPINFKSIDNLT